MINYYNILNLKKIQVQNRTLVGYKPSRNSRGTLHALHPLKSRYIHAAATKHLVGNRPAMSVCPYYCGRNYIQFAAALLHVRCMW